MTDHLAVLEELAKSMRTLAADIRQAGGGGCSNARATERERCADELDAAIALMRGQSWQPIETAPKDGANLLLCVSGFVPAVGKWERDRWTFRDASEFPTQESYTEYLDSTAPNAWPVTHWQPLPAPPKDTADEQ